MNSPVQCWYRGETHIERMRSYGIRIKLGIQRCPYCGAEIEVTEKREGWAFTPPHDKPASGRQRSESSLTKRCLSHGADREPC